MTLLLLLLDFVCCLHHNLLKSVSPIHKHGTCLTIPLNCFLVLIQVHVVTIDLFLLLLLFSIGTAVVLIFLIKVFTLIKLIKLPLWQIGIMTTNASGMSTDYRFGLRHVNNLLLHGISAANLSQYVKMSRDVFSCLSANCSLSAQLIISWASKADVVVFLYRCNHIKLRQFLLIMPCTSS